MATFLKYFELIVIPIKGSKHAKDLTSHASIHDLAARLFWQRIIPLSQISVQNNTIRYDCDLPKYLRIFPCLELLAGQTICIKRFKEKRNLRRQ